MTELSSGNVEPAVRVVVTPSQSSYFAGEPFSVTITFTNIRSPEAGPPRASSHSHKRGAHSISSAPLARPPTSPGTPRTPGLPIPPRSRTQNDKLGRKGLIGRNSEPIGNNSEPKGFDELPTLIEQRRKKLLAKSLSVTISPKDLDVQLGEGTLPKSASFAQNSFRGAQHECMFQSMQLPILLTLPLQHLPLL